MKKERNTKTFNVILSELYKRIADTIILCLFFAISVTCSLYVWLHNSSVDMQVIIGFIALFFSFLFAAIGNIIFNDMEQASNQTRLLTKVKQIFFWLGAANLTVFTIHVYASNYPEGWILKILFLLVMGAGNQILLRYQPQPQYIHVNYKNQNKAA